MYKTGSGLKASIIVISFSLEGFQLPGELFLPWHFFSLPPSFLLCSLPFFLPFSLAFFSPPSFPSFFPSFLSHFSYTVNSQLLVLTQSSVKVSPLICCSRRVSWSHTSSLVGHLESLIRSWHSLWNLGSPPVLTASTPGSTAPLALSLRSVNVPGSLRWPIQVLLSAYSLSSLKVVFQNVVAKVLR